jgi:hypothetical protein
LWLWAWQKTNDYNNNTKDISGDTREKGKKEVEKKKELSRMG